MTARPDCRGHVDAAGELVRCEGEGPCPAHADPGHAVARVICESPALLVAHLEALGARVVTPPLTAMVQRGDGRYVARTQASVDLLSTAGGLPALHLIVADDPPPISASEFRARVALRQAQAKRGQPC